MIHTDMPAADYHALDRISAHGLMLMERSPAHYHHARLNPREPTAAQALGTLVHLLVLEPDTRCVAVAPNCDRRTREGKAAWEYFRASTPDGALIVTREQWDAAEAMREAVYSNPYADALLAAGQAESSLLWTDAETGIECKARPDWLCLGHSVVVDIKTATDASSDAFARAAASYRYHLQAAWYLDAASACGIDADAFVFVVVENEPPYSVALYTMDDEAIHSGRYRARRALARYAECLRLGNWPSYPSPITTLSLPKWAL